MNPLGTMKTVLLVMIVLCLTSCRAADSDRGCRARINHIVLMKLEDPDAADDLILDCRSRLETIPTVKGSFTGRHGDFGRAAVDSDYDVGFFVSFDSKDDYMRYLAHPEHVQVVRKWKPRCEWMRIHDVVDETAEATN
tara:strand:+ start:26534 stop:26947 length:414 start_codon:yes stop_codon:yes gene_type:complete